MAAEASIQILCELTGLGQLQELAEKFTSVSTPTRALYQYMVQATANTAEALDVSDVATVDMLILKCVSNDVDLDLDFDTAFDADCTVQEGEVAVIPTPAGTVYFKNQDNDETSTIEYLVIGR